VTAALTLLGPVATAAVTSPVAGAAAVVSAPGRVVFPVPGGVVKTRAIGAGASRVVALPDGGAVLVGRSGTSERGFYAAELTPSGGLDPSFGDRGIADVAVDSPPAIPLQVLRQSDGKLVVIVSGRRTTAFSFGQLLVVRLDADGSLDTTFGAGGIATAPVAPTCGACQTASLAPNGDIVLTGAGGLLSAALGGDPSAPAEWDVVSLTAAGALDTGFGAGGLDTITATDADGYDVEVLPSGEVMTLGAANLASAAPTALLTLLGPDGGSDRSFNGGTPVTLPPGAAATALLVEPDGSAIVGGSTTLFGFTPRGAPDPKFASNGVLDLGGLPRPLQLLPAAGNDVLVIGRAPGTSNTLSAVRITGDGSVDATLGGPTGIRVRPRFGGGTASPSGSAAPPAQPPLAQDSFAAHAVAARPDGSYVAVGGVDIAAPAGNGRYRSIAEFAAAGLSAGLAPVAGFGGPAGRVAVKLSVPPQSTATARSTHGIVVSLDVSAPGLARVRIKAGGRVIAEGVDGVFAAGRHGVKVRLTAYGAGVLRGQDGVRVTASATARDLVTEGTTASATGTLS
jgi:uncharacterized delta-60 repeat protein